MHPENARRVVLAHARGHQQQGLCSPHHSLLGLRRADYRFDRLTLLTREG